MAFSPSNFYFSPPDTNAKIKALFVYNFSKYFEWPETYRNPNSVFTIGVLGTSIVTEELEAITATKTVGAQKIEVKVFNSVADIKKCHILYIPAESSASLSAVIAKIKGFSTLLITEKDGYAKQGSVINFVVQSQKQRFELSKNNAEKFDLKVSSSLESLAIKVD